MMGTNTTVSGTISTVIAVLVMISTVIAVLVMISTVIAVLVRISTVIAVLVRISTFGCVLSEDGEVGHLVGDAVDEAGTRSRDTGGTGLVHIELERRLCIEDTYTHLD
jgi:hypothetical protein